MTGKKLPSDLQVREEIYGRHREEYATVPVGQRTAMIPIDIQAIADALGTDADVVFGRLYYHLEQKHGYTRPNDDVRVALFALEAGGKKDCVNLPYLSSLLASMRDDDRGNG
jgi:hypothetical protein